MRRTLLSTVSFIAVLLAPWGLSWAQSVPSNFSQGTYSSGLGQITGMNWAKDGTDDLLFVSQKSGEIRVIKNGTLQSANVARITVTTNNEAGLDDLIVDPSYSSNKFIYVFACLDIGGGQFRHRIFRFTISNGTTVGTSAGPTQIGPDTPCMNVNHNGGGMAIGADGFLYMGTGNLGNGNNVGGDGTSSEWTSLGAKIIRIDRFSGAAVTTNPWYSDPVHTNPVMKYVFAKGFRNPFGLRMRPGTNDLWLSEVGDSWEQIFLVTPGSTQGWPTENNTTDGTKLKVKLAYQTNVSSFGGCLTRGCFYTGSSFPSTYSGNFFFVDYNSGKMMRAVLNGTHDGFTSAAEFVTGNSSLTDINVGPDGSLYYASLGGSIFRLVYKGAAVQSLVVSPTSLSINEGASGSFTVKLASAPASNVTVGASRTAGVTTVTNTPATLTFTPANWNLAQTVTVSSAVDSKSTDEVVTISCSSAGLSTVNVYVTAKNSGTSSIAPTVVFTAPRSGDKVSGTNADWYGFVTDPQGIATVSKVEFFEDGVLKYTDVNPGTDPGWHPHFGGDHLRWNTTVLSNGVHTLTMKAWDTSGLFGSVEESVTVSNTSPTQGLTGQYYDNIDFTTLKVTRTDPTVNFDWGTGSPDPSIGPDTFSVRWTGQVQAQFSETYTFYTDSDDGVRLWVNGQLVINNWTDHAPTENSGTISLAAGQKYDLKMEYYENGGGAQAKLLWSSPSTTKQVIPQSRLFPTSSGVTLKIGDPVVEASDDSGNANLLLAQQATLGQGATLQSLSFYVTQAAGKLRLGLYDASGPGGGPGALKAQTAELTPVVGWNTANVTTPITLPAGAYWLAYLPSDNNLHFRIERSTGTSAFYSFTYGPMPSTFSASPTRITGNWSFYATLAGP